MVIKNFEGYEIRSVHEQKYASRWGALKDNQYRIFIKNLATGKYSICKIILIIL